LPIALAGLLVACSAAGCSDARARSATSKSTPARASSTTRTGAVDPVPAQSNKLSPQLTAHLTRLDDSDFVSVVIHLDPAFEPTREKRQEVVADAEGQNPRERRDDARRLLTDFLRQNATNMQAELRGALDDGRDTGLVRRVHQLWLVNALACELRKDFLLQLVQNAQAMQRVAVQGIRHDPPRVVVAGVPAEPAVEPQGWGIQKIGADSLYASGIEGAGALVAVIDLGFDIYHPDLVSRIWNNLGEDVNADGVLDAADVDGLDNDSNGFVDDFHGWDFDGFVAGSSTETGDNDPAGTNPHGTAVAGIVAGDGAGGFQTGVAPEAMLMLLKVGASVEDATVQGQVWAAMQYAAANGADVIHMSLKWRKGDDPDLVSWREYCDLLAYEKEILVVSVAGNGADLIDAPPWSITTPGRVASVLTVGATDQNDELWYSPGGATFSAEGSNTGPVTWEDVAGYDDYPDPPGLLKPDVVAPGVEITSTYLSQPPNRYRSMYTATSFAAPHVSGLAALLLQLNPSLGGIELRYLLEESALELPTSASPGASDLDGPDPVYGWGRIQAPEAAALLPIPSAPYDLEVTPNPWEWTSTDIWVDNDRDGVEDTPVAESINHLYARVRNIGGGCVGNVRLVFYFADIATTGIDDFDPNGDGDPEDGVFTYIGEYVVPLLGPAGSKHEAAEGVVQWVIPMPTEGHWCVGVAALAQKLGVDEADKSNNRAFRNFVELVVTTSANLEFMLTPPEEGEDGDEASPPFDLVIERVKLPQRVKLSLRVDKSQVPIFAEAAAEAGRSFRHPRRDGPGGPRYLSLNGLRRLGPIRAPGGEPLPVGLTVRVPPDVVLPREARVVLSVRDAEGRVGGGLTVQLVRPAAKRRVGPHDPNRNR